MTIIANFSSNIYNNQQKYKHFLKCSISKFTIEIATVLFKENFIAKYQNCFFFNNLQFNTKDSQK